MVQVEPVEPGQMASCRWILGRQRGLWLRLGALGRPMGWLGRLVPAMARVELGLVGWLVLSLVRAAMRGSGRIYKFQFQ